MQPDLHDCFANAPFVENGWMIALEELGRQTGSMRAQIIGLGGPAAVPFNYISNLGDGRFVDTFVEINGGDPRVNWRVAASRGQFDVVAEQDYRAVRRAGKFDVYDDFAHSHEMPNGCQTLLSNDGNGFLGLATLRSVEDGETNEEQRALFGAIAPTVLRAIRLQQALQHQGATLLVGAMEAMGSATILLDSHAQIIALTPSAEREVALQHCIALRHRTLRAIDRAADQRLQQAIGRLLVAGPGRAAERHWLSDPRDHGAGLVCEIYALPVRDWTFGAAPRLMLTLRTPRAEQADAAKLLQDAFGLSLAEAHVALMIAAGQSRVEVAQQRQVRPETINDQLKSIFRKTDVRRESEMVALITRMIG